MANVVFQSVTPATPSAGEKVAVNTLGNGDDVQLVQIDLATAAGTSSPVTPTNPLPVLDGAYTTGRLTNVSVGTTATQLPASALANRKRVRVTNPANPFGYPSLVTIGYANTVTPFPTAAGGNGGAQLQPGQTKEFRIVPGQLLYAITTTQALVVQVEEFA